MPKKIFLRVANLEYSDTVKKLKAAKAHFLSSEFEKTVRFRLDQHLAPSQKKEYGNYAWLTVRNNGKSSVIEFEESNPRNADSKIISSIKISDFIDAARIMVKTIPDKEYDYMETKREMYVLSGALLVLEELPLLKCTLIMEGRSKKELESIYKKLNLKGKIEPNFNLKLDSYYRIRGFDYDLVKTVYKKKLSKLIGDIDV